MQLKCTAVFRQVPELDGELPSTNMVNEAACSRLGRPTVLGTFLLTILGTACTESSREPDPLDLPEWTVDEQPTWSLIDDGTPENGFGNVLPWWLDDGNVLIGDRTGRTIRIVTQDGTPVRTIARSGSGPGEIEGSFKLVVDGDTVVVIESNAFRPNALPEVDIYSIRDGRLSSMRPRADSVITTVGYVSSGQLLVRRGSGFRALDPLTAPEEIEPHGATFGVFTPPETGEIGTVTWLPEVVEHWTHKFPAPPGFALPVMIGTFDLAPRDIVIASGDQVWRVGTAGTVAATDAMGREVFSTTLGIVAPKLAPSEIGGFRDQRLANARSNFDSAQIRGWYESAIVLDSMPSLDEALAGFDGEVWVRQLHLDPMSEQRFIAIDRQGDMVARVSLPAAFTLHQIGESFVLGVRRDELGVETIVAYSLSRT